MKTYLLHPATFKLDGGAMFGIIPKPLWQKKIQADELNRIHMSLRVMYFETENRKILVDTGIGEYHNEKFFKNFDIKGKSLPWALNSVKVSPDKITDIILTHLHFDHVGGLGDENNNPVFKNAKIHLHKKHYEYALNPSDRDKGSFHTHVFKNLLEQHEIQFLNELDGIILKDGDDEIRYKTSFGHTPYMIHPYTDQYIYMADLVPMAHHVPIPWVMGYDIEPAITTKYKKEFYDFIKSHNLTMILEHDNESYGGVLQETEKGFQVESLKSVTNTFLEI